MVFTHPDNWADSLAVVQWRSSFSSVTHGRAQRRRSFFHILVRGSERWKCLAGVVNEDHYHLEYNCFKAMEE